MISYLLYMHIEKLNLHKTQTYSVQKDPDDLLSHWASIWQMKFNAIMIRCVVHVVIDALTPSY